MKLSIAVINKINKHKCNGTEIDLLIHIAQYQQPSGEVPNVHYKEFVEAYGKYDCEYYNALKSLEEKGIIEINETDKSAYRNVIIKDNNYQDQDSFTGNRYVNVHMKLWHTEEFKTLKASAKRFILKLVLDTNKNKNPLYLTSAKIAERACLAGTDKRAIYQIIEAVKALSVEQDKVFAVEEVNRTKNGMRQFTFKMVYDATRTTASFVPNKATGGFKPRNINTEQTILKTYAVKMFLKKHRIPATKEDIENLLVMDYSFSKLGRKCQTLWANKLKELFVQYKKQIKEEGTISSVCRIVQKYMQPIRDRNNTYTLEQNNEPAVACPLV